MMYEEIEEERQRSPSYQSIQLCDICEQNGFPGESIRRLTTYGSRDSYIVDYETGESHKHFFNMSAWEWRHYEERWS